jgi:polysaccharide export outer membrane protein
MPVKPIRHSLLVLLSCLALAGCALPRGAGLVGEVLKEQDSESPTFQVVEVTRAGMAQLASWPRARSTGGHGWIKAGRGPDSQIIRANDRVSVTIWDNEPNSLLTSAGGKSITIPEVAVSSDGTIFLPYVEKVAITGQTPDQARTTLQEALARVAPSAQVQLSVQPGQGNAVDVVAGVARPGTYPLPDRNSSILSVIAQAGGIPPDLRNPLVRLIRGGRTYEIAADRLLADAAMNTTLQGRDKIVVEEDARYFTALGATGTERIVYFDQESISALEAMSMLGGLSEGRANPRGVLILRDYPASVLRRDGSGPAMTQVVFTFDLTGADGLFAARSFEVAPGDTVLATESPVVAARTIAALVGSFFSVVNTAQATSE